MLVMYDTIYKQAPVAGKSWHGMLCIKVYHTMLCIHCVNLVHVEFKKYKFSIL